MKKQDQDWKNLTHLTWDSCDNPKWLPNVNCKIK